MKGNESSSKHPAEEDSSGTGVVLLLEAFRSCFYDEEPFLKFNYFILHERLHKLLRRFDDELGVVVNKEFGWKELEPIYLGWKYVRIVFALLEARDLHRRKKSSDGSIAQGEERRKFFEGIQRIMNEFVAEHGNIAQKELKVFSKNKTIPGALENNLDA